MAMLDVTIRTQVQAEIGNIKWSPKECISRDGMTFVPIDRYNRPFVRMLIGRTVKSMPLSSTCMSSLVQLRNDAATGAVISAMTVDDGDGSGDGNAKPAKRPRRQAQQRDEIIAAPVFSIILPAWICGANQLLQELKVNVLFKGVPSRTVWAELTGPLLKYLAIRVRHEDAERLAGADAVAGDGGAADPEAADADALGDGDGDGAADPEAADADALGDDDGDGDHGLRLDDAA
jgi:hypothetical protein